jgi:PAS domain-containing protein
VQSASCLPPDAPFSCGDYLSSIHPDDREDHRRALDLAIEKTGRFAVKYRVRWPDGSLRRVHVLGSVAEANSGTPLRIVGASVEISD